jgi:hypothetical protein
MEMENMTAMIIDYTPADGPTPNDPRIPAHLTPGYISHSIKRQEKNIISQTLSKPTFHRKS